MSSSVASAGAETRVATVPVICGPTASGKTAAAMWLAARHDLEIVSADSRQVYRGFDVGTAKPSREEQARVPHHGIDIVEPTVRYSAAQWADMAMEAIDGAHARGRTPLVVGGTGLYVAALFRPLWQEPAVEAERRAAVQRSLSQLDTARLKQFCETLDPARAHLGRTQLLRAVEVALLTGQRLSALHRLRARSSRYRAHYLLVDPGPVLQARIAARAATMLEHGWVDEVRTLSGTIPPGAPAWKSTGYDAVRAFVAGEIGRDAALERVTIQTRQYAKRQRTWFRHQLEQDRVTTLSTAGAGWEREVERWFHDVEETMASERAR